MILCGHLGQVAVAALEHEGRLGHHGQAEGAISGRWRACGMTPPCSMRSPGRAPAASNAASASASSTAVTQWTATARPPAARLRDAGGESVQVRQAGLVEQHLHRPDRKPPKPALQRPAAHQHQPLRQIAGAMGGGQRFAALSASVVALASVTPVTPQAASGRPTGASGGSARPIRALQPGVAAPDTARRPTRGVQLDHGGGGSPRRAHASARLFSIQSEPVRCCTRKGWRGASRSSCDAPRSPATAS